MSKIDQETMDLLQRLELLKDWQKKRKDINNKKKRAFVIEFAGMPKAGKSTTIENIGQFLSYGVEVLVKESPLLVREGLKKFTVHTPAEGVSLRTPKVLKESKIKFNSWAGAYALQELFQARHDDNNDVVVLDRGPWDAGCWLEYWENKEEEIDSELSSAMPKIIEFFQLPAWQKMSDLHVVFVVDPEEALRREKKVRLIPPGGPAADRKLMKTMLKIYTDKSKALSITKAKQCPHVGEAAVLFIDTTTPNDPRGVAKEVLRGMFTVLERKIAELEGRKLEDLKEITVKGLEKILDPYLRNMKSEERESTVTYLAEFVKKANKLPPDRQAEIEEQLENRKTVSIQKRKNVEANILIDELEKLLGKATHDEEDKE